MERKSAIITGVRGQDGSYLAELLLTKGYRVIGTTRGDGALDSEWRDNVELTDWNLRDMSTILALIESVKPTEVYNFAAYSSGATMFDDPEGIGEVNGLAVTRILEAIRSSNPVSRFFQASSSEMFGAPTESPQSEATPFQPLSPYAAAKLYAHNMVRTYRRSHGLFACSGILFNHESPRRGVGFVTRKVTDGVARIKLGLAHDLPLGSLDSRRDWGFSGDYVMGAWKMLQAEEADDFVLATGRTHSVRDLCECAFSHVDLDYRDYVREGGAPARQHETKPLVGDAAKAVERLGWGPSISFHELIRLMVDADLDRHKRLNGGGG